MNEGRVFSSKCCRGPEIGDLHERSKKLWKERRALPEVSFEEQKFHYISQGSKAHFGTLGTKITSIWTYSISKPNRPRQNLKFRAPLHHAPSPSSQSLRKSTQTQTWLSESTFSLVRPYFNTVSILSFLRVWCSVTLRNLVAEIPVNNTSRCILIHYSSPSDSRSSTPGRKACCILMFNSMYPGCVRRGCIWPKKGKRVEVLFFKSQTSFFAVIECETHKSSITFGRWPSSSLRMSTADHNICSSDGLIMIPMLSYHLGCLKYSI